MSHTVYANFPGRILMVGFGSIGQGVLPLILRHVGIKPERITVLSAEDTGADEAAHYGVRFIREALTRENFRRILDPLLGRGDFLLNVSVDVSSIALIKYSWEKGAMYLDTCIEPWPAVTPIPARRSQNAPTTPCARKPSRCATPTRAHPPPCSRTAPTPVSSRTW